MVRKLYTLQVRASNTAAALIERSSLSAQARMMAVCAPSRPWSCSAIPSCSPGC